MSKCKQCGAENPAAAAHCASCGRQITKTGVLLDHYAGELDKLQKSSEAELDAAAAALDEFSMVPAWGPAQTAEPPKAGRKSSPQADPESSQKPMRPDEEASQPLKPATLPGSPLGWDNASSVERKHSHIRSACESTTNHLQVSMPHLDVLNYALFHAGASTIRNFTIQNVGQSAAENLRAEVSILPKDYGDTWRMSIPSIAPDATWVESHVDLPLRVDRLRVVAESERASLQATIYLGQDILWTRTDQITIHPYNHWLLADEAMALLAVFVTPNQPAVQEFITRAAKLLARRTGDASFSGYQVSTERVREMIAALHDTLAQDYKITYIPPPASFDEGQKIRSPAEILQHGCGTCLDLSVLLAALMEQVGLHPIIVLLSNHAFLGCWNRGDRVLKALVMDLLKQEDPGAIVKSSKFLFFNSVNLCNGQLLEEAEETAADYLEDRIAKGSPVDLLDIHLCREKGITPLP